MQKAICFRAALITCLLTAAMLAMNALSGIVGLPQSVAAESNVPGPPGATPVAVNSTYYQLRADLRRCRAPLCGGYYVKRVNQPRTRCTNGQLMFECYVAEVDWNGQPQVEINRALLRADLEVKLFDRFGRFGVLRVIESWQATNDNPTSDNFFRVRDKGVRCITSPCLTHHESKLNSRIERDIAGVDLKAITGASDEAINEAFEAMTEPEGIIVSGKHVPVTGPTGRATELKALQFYMRPRKEVSNKPCIKTGCSSHVCSDESVITTCEWREEYECYQKARCERQADGKCGFTRTPALTACLRRAR